MGVKDMAEIVRRHWVWVLGAVLLGTALGAGAYAVAPKTYTAQTVLYVATKDATDAASLSQGAAYVQSQIRSYPLLVTSPDVLRAVATDTGQDAGALAGAVTAEVPTDSAVLTISAQADDPRRAAVTAESFGRRASERIQLIETRPGAASPVRITTVAPPVPPSSPSSPNLRVFLALGLVAGALVGLLAAVARDRLAAS